MNLTVSRSATEAVVTVQGELDAASAHDVYTAAVAEAERGPGHVVLDPAGVSFIDSVGLGMLVRTRDDLARDLDSRLTLRSPTENVRRILTLTALYDQFTISG